MTTTFYYTAALAIKTDQQNGPTPGRSNQDKAVGVAAAQTERCGAARAPMEMACRAAAGRAETGGVVRAVNPQLGWPLRLFIFVTAIGLLGTLFAAQYEDQGQQRKAEQCWMTMIIGLVSSGLAIFLTAIL
jgi:hypothetical protein